MDWHYITEDRAKDNIRELALEAVRRVTVGKYIPEEISVERRYDMVSGIMLLMDDFIKSLEEKEED